MDIAVEISMYRLSEDCLAPIQAGPGAVFVTKFLPRDA